MTLRWLPRPHPQRGQQQAAEAVGTTVAAIANSLVLAATLSDGSQIPLLVLTSRLPVTPHAVFPTSVEKLLRITGGRSVSVRPAP